MNATIKDEMVSIRDDETLVKAVRTAHDGERCNLPIADNGEGQLWLYEESFGPMGVVRAKTWEKAYEAVQDYIMRVVPESDLLEAYGFSIVKHNGRYHVCSELLEGGVREFSDELDAREFVLVYVLENHVPLVEGFEYQPNGTGTGIVEYDLNDQHLQPLTRALADEYAITVIVEGEETP